MTDRGGTAGRAFVRTVLGDVDPAGLGRVNHHEHLFQATPLLPGDELDDERLSGQEIAAMRAAGMDAMVDATPWGLGRNPAGVARISASTGVVVVATAGFHREVHYADRPVVQETSIEAMARQCESELFDGQPVADAIVGGSYDIAVGPGGGPVRAGMLKVGIGYWSITPFERRAIEAIATAHRASGAPVMVHLEHGTCAHEVLDLLAAYGVAERRVVLAHIDRSPDAVLYGELATRGAYLGCDGAARLRAFPESMLIDAIAGAVAAGHGDRVLLGGDVARRSRYLAYGGMPGLRYLPARFVPRVADRVGDDAVRSFLVDNPRRVLTWSSPTAACIEPQQEA